MADMTTKVRMGPQGFGRQLSAHPETFFTARLVGDTSEEIFVNAGKVDFNKIGGSWTLRIQIPVNRFFKVGVYIESSGKVKAWLNRK